MKKITTTENREIEVSDDAHLAILKLKLSVNFIANTSASSGRPIIADLGKAFLRGTKGYYFLEVYKSGEIYPTVYSVNYEAPDAVEVTEDEFQNWLKNNTK
jgi:hypothetical protein